MNKIPQAQLLAIKQKSKQMAMLLFFDMSEQGPNKAFVENRTPEKVYDAVFKTRSLSPYSDAGQLEPILPLFSELTLLRMLTESASLNEFMLQEQYHKLTETCLVDPSGKTMPEHIVNIELGEQAHIIVSHPDNGTAIEIAVSNNQGTPVVSLGVCDDDPILHLYPAADGLLLAPGSSMNFFYSGEDQDSLYGNPYSQIIR